MPSASRSIPSLLRGSVLLALLLVRANGATATPDPARRVTNRNTSPVANALQVRAGPSLVGRVLYLPGLNEATGNWGLWGSREGSDRATLLASLEAQQPISLNGRAFFLATQGYAPGLWTSDGTTDGTRLVRSLGESGYAYDLLEAGELLYFVGPDRFPWRSDGSAEGTRPLSRIPVQPFNPSSNFLEWNGAVFFVAVQGGRLGLYRTNGSSSGTDRVADLGEEGTGRRAYGLATAGALLSFFTFEPDGFFRMWTSDGTSGGTTPLRDFAGDYPDVCPCCCPMFGPDWLSHAATAALFFANDGVHGRELWRSDGTAEGTQLVKDIRPTEEALESKTPRVASLVPALPPLLYGFDDGIHGGEVWRTDGTEAGTYLFADLVPGPESSYPGRFVPRGDVTYFSATGDIWRTDGTVSGTHVFRSEAGIASAIPTGFTFVDASGLWRSDGVVASLVDDLKRPRGLFPIGLAAAAGRLGFVSLDSDNLFRSFWAVDEGASDARLVREFERISALPVSTGGAIVLGADDGESGIEPWLSDSTVEGTRLLRNIAFPVPGWLGVFDSSPDNFRTAAGRLFFTAFEGIHGYELWSTDGTENGTRLVKDIRPGDYGSVPNGLTSFRGQLYFTTYIPNGLWRTDGSAAGTLLVRELELAERLMASGGLLYFVAADDAHGSELWVSDGTTSGTRLAKDIRPGPASPNIYGFVGAMGKMFFEAQSDQGEELWVSDGTGPGTQMLGEFWGVSELTAGENRLFFTAADHELGSELWVTDGTREGTRRIRDILEGEGGSEPTSLFSIRGLLLFSAQDAHHGRELWRTDGTAEGTYMLQDIAPGPASSNPAEFREAGARVYFRAADESSGSQVWALPSAALFPEQPGRPPRRTRVLPPRD